MAFDLPSLHEEDIYIMEYQAIEGQGLSILFSIKNILFRRDSLLGTHQLLWWKWEETHEYCTKEEANQLEGIIKNHLAGDKFKEILQLA